MGPETHNNDVNCLLTRRCFSVRASFFISPFKYQFPLYKTPKIAFFLPHYCTLEQNKPLTGAVSGGPTVREAHCHGKVILPCTSIHSKISLGCDEIIQEHKFLYRYLRIYFAHTKILLSCRLIMISVQLIIFFFQLFSLVCLSFVNQKFIEQGFCLGRWGFSYLSYFIYLLLFIDFREGEGDKKRERNIICCFTQLCFHWLI